MLLAQNINPAQQRMNEKAAASPEKGFEIVALNWHKTNKKWSADYADRILASIKNHVFPVIGHMPVTMLKTQHFTALLKVIENNGFLEVASRARQQILQYHALCCSAGTHRKQPGTLSGRCYCAAGITIPPCRWSGCPNCLSALVIISRDGS